MANYTPLRWGVLGAGSIAKRFCDDASPLTGHKFQAVGSRDQAKADAFADKYQMPDRHNSYEALVANPNVDVIYVATPHNFHKEHALLALDAGKAVLCEKPFTINRAEAEVVVARAREKNLFLMEGMWSRCFPAMAKVRELVKNGAIGEPRMLQADFGFRSGVNPEGRLFNLALGGGGLMDVGVYCVSLASMFFGEPSRIASLATIGETGVDEQAGMLLGYENGALSVLSTAIRTNTPHEAILMGTDGQLKIAGPWWKPSQITVKGETHDFPMDGGGFQYEAEHVAECLRQGLTESPLMPLDETLSIMGTLDALRAQFGIKYPME